MEILIVIPARGGSKAIPRKNLRLLAGKPLIHYAINTALNSKFNADIYVSSDDIEILNIAKKYSVKNHKRDSNISGDEVTLDPVIYSCFIFAQKEEKKKYDIVVTLQPTSPLLSANSLDNALQKIIINKYDTVIAAKNSTHLTWKKENERYLPNYRKRLNRQYLTPSYTETGAFLITKSYVISKNNRIGSKVDLEILSDGEEIDIDNYQDWNLCEYLIRKKHILFVVTGNQNVGLGHVYNTLLVANDILNHSITFLVDSESKLAYKVIKSKNYPVFIQKHKNILDDIKNISPNVIINDRLDTSKDYIQSLIRLNYKVINFEDLGEGIKYADAIINAIYRKSTSDKNHYFGQKYFILRDEFILSEVKKVGEKVKNVLLTFGGVDPNNFTKKILDIIYYYCINNNIKINVIAGIGYNKYDTIKSYKSVNIMKDVANISDYMLKADIIFTSAGRTIYEVACIGTPAIVLSQNQRETTHFFASKDNGFSNLGLGENVSDSDIMQEFLRIVNSYKDRYVMSKLMLKNDLKSGRKRVNKIITNLIKI